MATSVITVTETGDEKPRISTATWNMAMPMALIITAAAAQARPR